MNYIVGGANTISGGARTPGHPIATWGEEVHSAHKQLSTRKIIRRTEIPLTRKLDVFLWLQKTVLQRPRWGSLQRSCRPLIGFKGPLRGLDRGREGTAWKRRKRGDRGTGASVTG